VAGDAATFVASLNSAAPRWTAAAFVAAGRSGRGCASIHDSMASIDASVSFGPDMRVTNTSFISWPKLLSSPSSGTAPSRAGRSAATASGAGPRRAGRSQSKFHTRPSSLPSRWHEAQATKPPALAWKKKCPASPRVVRRQRDAVPSASASIGRLA
jgi:hypothetical protein